MNVIRWILFVFILTWLSPSSLLAQEETDFVPDQTAAGVRFKAALTGGVNLSQLEGDLLSGYHRVGFNVGGEVSVVLARRWTATVELLYSQKGSRRNFRSDGPDGVFRAIRTNFVEAPFLINYFDWKLRISAGLAYGRLIDFEVVDVFNDDITEEFDFRSDYLSVLTGATYFFNEHWGLNIRHGWELTDLRADENDDNLMGMNWTIRGLYQF